MTTEFVSRMKNPLTYEHKVNRVALVETHISWVFLTGRFVYKVKKPVKFPFADFSSVELRRNYCFEELRLNRRTLPDTYVDVLEIREVHEDGEERGREEKRVNKGEDSDVKDVNLMTKGRYELVAVKEDDAVGTKAVDYAVQIKQFPPSSLLSDYAKSGMLTEAHVREAAKYIAKYHSEAPVTSQEAVFGTSANVLKWTAENFDELLPLLGDEPDLNRDIEELKAWTKQAEVRLEPLFNERKRGGLVRECHGDLHLENLVRIDGLIRPFDCIEFNAELRNIDVISDIAFLLMDLRRRGLALLAPPALSAYLEYSGDYKGTALVDYYIVYRALVRAKISRRKYFDLVEAGDMEKAVKHLQDFNDYMATSKERASLQSPSLIITCGVSGSGKSHVCSKLLPLLNAIQIRSDVEKKGKRLLGLDIDESTHSEVGKGAYTTEMNDRTYEACISHARMVLRSGYVALVDATFLEKHRRDEARELARELQCPFCILHLIAPDEVLRERIERRKEKGDVSEADLKVLDQQLQSQEEIVGDELPFRLPIDTSKEIEPLLICAQIHSIH